KALRRQIEDRMHAPQTTGFAVRPTLLGDGRSINDPDQPSSSRGRNRSPRARTDQTTDEDLEPWHGFAQPLEQRNIRKRGETDRLGPRRRQSEPHCAEAIRQSEAQQIDGAFDFTDAPKCADFSSFLLQSLGAAETIDGL